MGEWGWGGITGGGDGEAGESWSTDMWGEYEYAGAVCVDGAGGAVACEYVASGMADAAR